VKIVAIPSLPDEREGKKGKKGRILLTLSKEKWKKQEPPITS